MKRAKVLKTKSRSIPIPRKFLHALYWRARLAEEEGNPAMARAFYQKLSDRFRNYYYAEFGRQRLKALPARAPASPKDDHAETSRRRRTTRCSIAFPRFQRQEKLPQPLLPTTICVSNGRVCSPTEVSPIWPCANCRPRPARKAEPGRLPRWRVSIRMAAATIAASRS